VTPVTASTCANPNPGMRVYALALWYPTAGALMRIRAMGVMAAVLLCAACGQPSHPGQAAHPGLVKYYGAGGESCGQWMEARKGTHWYPEGQWVLGWVSAVASYNQQRPLRETHPAAIAAWVDEYCRKQPLSNLADAAESLVAELAKPE
jgi:hypothetical protein